MDGRTLRTGTKALSATTVRVVFMPTLLSIGPLVTSDFVWYMADAAMMRTLSNLTRRGKANRLQDGIGRDVPINRQDGWTITRSVTKSPGPSLPTASAVDGCKDLPTARRTRVPARSSAHYLGSTRKVQSAGLSVLSESAQKRCQLLVKCDGNCSAMPVKTW